jgi:hypothetical protein
MRSNRAVTLREDLLRPNHTILLRNPSQQTFSVPLIRVTTEMKVIRLCIKVIQ